MKKYEQVDLSVKDAQRTAAAIELIKVYKNRFDDEGRAPGSSTWREIFRDTVRIQL